MVAVILVFFLVACAGDPVSTSHSSKWSRTAAKARSSDTCPSYPLPTASTADLLSKLRPFLEEATANISAALQRDHSPGGAALSLVYGDAVIWTKGFGLINMSDPSQGAPTGDTGFRIGSITKVFTALMMLMYRDQGLLPSLDSNVTTYLPEFKIINPFQTDRGITFRQLASHMSGLPRNVPCKNIFVTGCNITDKQMYENLGTIELMFPPGLQPAYSNLGFGLLGRVLERIKGPKWEDQLKLMILDPLKMNNSGNSFTPDTIKRLAVGYYPDGAIADLINVGWDAPAGQMYSSTNDLSQLLKLAFRTSERYNPEIGQILDGESVREWMHPVFVYPDGTGFCLSWELVPLGNYTLLTKPGVLNGYNAEIQMAHEIKTGFVFLQSCDGCNSHQVIIDIAQQIILKASTALEALQSAPKLPPNPKQYTGVYQATEKISISLQTLSGHQVLLISGGTLSGLILEWEVEDSFQASAQGIAEPCYLLPEGHVGERVYFQRQNSEVVSLTLPGINYGILYQKV